jgi:hypothetical protein
MTNPAQTADKRYKVLAFVLGGVIIAYIVFHVFGLRLTTSETSNSINPNFPPGGPAEFLYLDPHRVNAYLAQVNGGTFDTEKVIRKLTNSLNANLGVPGAEGGGSQENETSVEREVKPTDASNFFLLRNGLNQQGELNEVGLRFFNRDIAHLHEGAFVAFQSTALLSPQYLNPYLAVREEHTIETMFPDSPRERKRAKEFSGTAGTDPRVVFALQRKGSTYLLPMDAAFLTTERSLLKYGGGKFTVVGKVVRVFPGPGDQHEPAYIDSPTRETWEQPLKRAPEDLLCRTNPNCVDKMRNEKMTETGRSEAAEEARATVLEALARQTTIEQRGAVILPVAIYK